MRSHSFTPRAINTCNWAISSATRRLAQIQSFKASGPISRCLCAVSIACSCAVGAADSPEPAEQGFGHSTKPVPSAAMGVAMSIDRSFQPTEWNTKASAGMHSQVPLAGMLAAVEEAHTLVASVVASATFSGCLVAAAQHSGKEDQDLAELIHISQGYMSRFMRGVGQQWAKRLVAFMRATNSLAPLQWLAHQMGCELVARSAAEREAMTLRARLVELERQGRAA